MIPSAEDFIDDLFSYPYKSFQDHLQLEDNNRILFSGKFGIGKTVFLNYFFHDNVQKRLFGDIKYNAFHIYPVNYSIAANDDIFAYIKYDVITSMLMKGVEVEESDFTFLETLPDFLRTNLDKVFALLIHMIPKIGKDVSETWGKFQKLRSEFEAHNKNINESESTTLISHLNAIENQEGGLYENGILTRLIFKIFARLKEESKLENVLIIDDLDRIDPEHIFRLLNIFAAHLDSSNRLPNKLGFDKIIIVCDVKNIRNIFSSKFGQLSDFNGYIDKFYSYDIFNLDNRKVITKLAYTVILNTKFLNVDERTSDFYQDKLFRNDSIALGLLSSLIFAGLIGLRTILNYRNSQFKLSTSISFNPYKNLFF